MIHLKQFGNICLHAGIVFLSEKEPVKLSCFAPLSFLTEILAHEKEFFAGMSEHICISDSQVGILVDLITGHLLHHRALEVDDLIV